MISLKPKKPFIYLAGNMLTLIFIFLGTFYLFRDFTFSKMEWLILSGIVILWFLVEYWRKLYYSYFNHEFRQRISTYFKANLGFFLVVLCFYLFVPIPVHQRDKVLAILIGISVLDISINFLFFEIVNSLSIAKKSLKQVLVAGTGNMARNVEKQLFAHQRYGYRLKGFINCNNTGECAVGQDKVLGDLDNINQYLHSNPVDEIIIALPAYHTREIQDVLTVADYHGIRVKYIPDYQEMFGKHYKITRYGHVDAVTIRQLPMDGRYALFLKNVFDKMFSAGVLFFLSPLFLALALLIKLDSRGPVFYFPVRIGKAGKPFRVFKFRSMRENDTAAGGVLSTQQDDPRITKVGRVLRKFSLDELPQFINVFLGDMSVVGPRPHRSFLDRQLQESVYHYMLRHYVKPGITGWAQVNGWRGPTDTEEQKRQRTSHDLWYIENWSLWLDVKIIYLTVFGKKTHQSAF